MTWVILALIALIAFPPLSSATMLGKLIGCSSCLMMTRITKCPGDAPQLLFFAWLTWAAIGCFLSDNPTIALVGSHLRYEGLSTWIMATMLAIAYWSYAPCTGLFDLFVFGIISLAVMAFCKAGMTEYDSSHLIGTMSGVSAYASIMGVIIFTYSWELSIVAVVALVGCGMRAGALGMAVGCGFVLMAKRWGR